MQRKREWMHFRPIEYGILIWHDKNWWCCDCIPFVFKIHQLKCFICCFLFAATNTAANRINNFRIQSFGSVVWRLTRYVCFICFVFLLHFLYFSSCNYTNSSNSVRRIKALRLLHLVCMYLRVCSQFTTTTVVIYSIDRNTDSSKRTVRLCVHT